MANGRYQDSLQLNRRNANDVPNEEYIEMGGAHSLFQPRVAGAELPRLYIMLNTYSTLGTFIGVGRLCSR